MSEAASSDALALILAAAGSADRSALAFHAVNRTVAAAAYDRAAWWDMRGVPAPLAVSGLETLDAKSRFVATWRRLLADATDGGKAKEPIRLPPVPLSGGGAEEVASCAVWLPLPETGQGICFERWGGDAFTDGEIGLLRQVCAGYALAWRALGGRGRGGLSRRALGWLIFFVLLAAALCWIKAPLRVMAGCEVTARSPVLIAAPMDGVIEEVTVRPGQEVGKGDVLAVYNPRLMEEELNLTLRRVAVVEAELASARARGFSEQRYRSEVSLLEARLEQERARLEGTETRMAMLRVTAPTAGMVQMDDARAWRGKPVATGQAVMWLVNPRDSRVSLWLPQDDRIEFDPARPVFVYLQALGGEPRRARLTHVSTFAQLSPDGVYAFPAEAEWIDDGEPPPLGLRGVASLTGGEVRLGYWLFRRPMAAIRLWLGY